MGLGQGLHPLNDLLRSLAAFNTRNSTPATAAAAAAAAAGAAARANGRGGRRRSHVCALLLFHSVAEGLASPAIVHRLRRCSLASRWHPLRKGIVRRPAAEAVGGRLAAVHATLPVQPAAASAAARRRARGPLAARASPLFAHVEGHRRAAAATASASDGHVVEVQGAIVHHPADVDANAALGAAASAGRVLKALPRRLVELSSWSATTAAAVSPWRAHAVIEGAAAAAEVVRGLAPSVLLLPRTVANAVPSLLWRAHGRPTLRRLPQSSRPRSLGVGLGDMLGQAISWREHAVEAASPLVHARRRASLPASAAAAATHGLLWRLVVALRSEGSGRRPPSLEDLAQASLLPAAVLRRAAAGPLRTRAAASAAARPGAAGAGSARATSAVPRVLVVVAAIVRHRRGASRVATAFAQLPSAATPPRRRRRVASSAATGGAHARVHAVLRSSVAATPLLGVAITATASSEQVTPRVATAATTAASAYSTGASSAGAGAPELRASRQFWQRDQQGARWWQRRCRCRDRWVLGRLAARTPLRRCRWLGAATGVRALPSLWRGGRAGAANIPAGRGGRLGSAGAAAGPHQACCDRLGRVARLPAGRGHPTGSEHGAARGRGDNGRARPQLGRRPG
mmetsp:Transcript_62368/g.203472  ORF Transcript_62368/g.203472 Transcript_62368/m.203472 type:complete len:629 (-) Transcript_62368:999-2885(-)